MKRILALITISLIYNSAKAQTNYGTGAGTQGASHTYYGYYAGNAAQSVSYENSFIGNSSGRLTTTGYGNTAVGFNTLRNNVGGYWNTVIGAAAMFQNTSGYRNVAIGRSALYNNTSGIYNVASGYNALFSNTTGYNNTAIGSYSLNENTSGDNNTGLGYQTLYSNTGGSGNLAIGGGALYSNLTGHWNVANGLNTLYENTSGTANTAAGSGALRQNTTGSLNTATGYAASSTTTTGTQNAAFGAYTLVSGTGSYNSAFGSYALYADRQICSGSYNSAFGAKAGPAVSDSPCDFNNTTALGAMALVTASNQVRIGNSSVTSIGGQVSWTTLSDGRFKREIRNDVAGLDFINQLKPVSYILDKTAINTFLRIPDSIVADSESARRIPARQVGFVAQEVDELVKKSGYVFSGVEVPQNDNDPYTIRYAEFVVPLVKAVQELTAKVDEQQKQMITNDERHTRELMALKEMLRQYGVSQLPDGHPSTGAALYQNNPNPYSGTTAIHMELPEEARHASIIVYNLEGKQLKDIEVSERGATAINVSGSEFNPGMYLYALIVDGRIIDTKRLVLTK